MNVYRRSVAVAACVAGLSLLAVIGGKSQGPATLTAKPADQINLGGPRELNAGKGLLEDGRSIRINPAAVRSYLAGSASLAFGSISGNGGCSSRGIPITGAVIGDRVVVGPPAELLTYSLAMTYAVTGADTVSIRLCNYTSATISPPSWTWNVDVVKSF